MDGNIFESRQIREVMPFPVVVAIFQPCYHANSKLPSLKQTTLDQILCVARVCCEFLTISYSRIPFQNDAV